MCLSKCIRIRLQIHIHLRIRIRICICTVGCKKKAPPVKKSPIFNILFHRDNIHSLVQKRPKPFPIQPVLRKIF
jgi:hypothetical protein